MFKFFTRTISISPTPITPYIVIFVLYYIRFKYVFELILKIISELLFHLNNFIQKSSLFKVVFFFKYV